MGSKNKAPKAPDYSGLIAQNKAAADQSFKMGQDQLDWAKTQYASDSASNKIVTNAALARQAVNDKNAASDRARYESVFQPLEDAQAKEAADYATPQRTALNMGAAQAGVAQQFSSQRDAALSNLEGYGVDPTSTRYAALDAGSRIQQAAASAGAGNLARVQTDAKAEALRSEAINVGRGYPGQIAGTYATAGQAGNTAVNTALATTGSGASTMGTGPQWQNLGQSALAGSGNLIGQGYNNQLAEYNANQNSSSGLGTLLGAGMQMAKFGMMADGGVAQAIPSEATSGGNIPDSASASHGRAVDDVDAKLTAGEFVIPKDVVGWFGEKHFQDLILKSRQAQPQAQAKPTYALGHTGPATFVSRPQQAIPAR